MSRAAASRTETVARPQKVISKDRQLSERIVHQLKQHVDERRCTPACFYSRAPNTTTSSCRSGGIEDHQDHRPRKEQDFRCAYSTKNCFSLPDTSLNCGCVSRCRCSFANRCGNSYGQIRIRRAPALSGELDRGNVTLGQMLRPALFSVPTGRNGHSPTSRGDPHE